MSSDRPRMKNPAAAGSLLRDLLQQRGMAEKLQDYRAWQVWDEVVGPQIAARARPSRLRDGVLEVRVDHPVWMQQLQLMKPSILARLAQHLKGGGIRDIFLQRGRVEAPPQAPVRVVSPPLPPLDECELAAVERVVEIVADTELRQRLRVLFTRQKQIEKSRRG